MLLPGAAVWPPLGPARRTPQPPSGTQGWPVNRFNFLIES